MFNKQVISYSDKIENVQADAAEEKMKVKPDDKNKQKTKQTDQNDKPNNRSNNNESGNCYW